MSGSLPSCNERVIRDGSELLIIGERLSTGQTVRGLIWVPNSLTTTGANAHEGSRITNDGRTRSPQGAHQLLDAHRGDGDIRGSARRQHGAVRLFGSEDGDL